ncbi:MAG TPA: energy transducer TonB [Candidatus Sulfotelmatobacter sp.]|nr:energy transducer TonB [Candidatus Sulfotelmatobacter sp.]
MKVFCACLLVSAAVWAHSQAVPETDDAPQPHVSIGDFGLVYPLSNDWVRATQLWRTKGESFNPPKFDILLAAVYVPKSDLSASSPFFELRAYRRPADCKKSLEAMIARSQDNKDKPEGGVEQFSAAGRDYFRVNLHEVGGRRHCVICTTANGHLLLWNAGAPNEKGMDAILATLNSITALPQPSAADSTESAGQKNIQTSPSMPVMAKPERVKVASGITSGLLIKKVVPTYPLDARTAHIQGTVLLLAEISKTGDIMDLELIGGPIELAGSAVAAVRQWKYKPYLLMGEPVAVETQIQVNYQLRP